MLPNVTLCFLLITVSMNALADHHINQHQPNETHIQSITPLQGEGCSGQCSKSPELDIDFKTLMERWNEVKNNETNPTSSPQLLIFVSTSMPEQSLKLWSEQAHKLGATLLLRGFVDDSLKKTVEKTRELFGETEAGGFSVDPERFQIFNIDKVPAVLLLTKECKNDVCNPEDYDLVYGDTSLVDALEHIARRGNPEGRKQAKQFLQKYRGGHG